MKSAVLIAVAVSGLLLQCKKSSTINKKAEQIVAENQYDLGKKHDLRIYSDSTYTFTTFEGFLNNEKIEKFDGFCFVNDDTIHFLPSSFIFNNSHKAIIKNNFIEFINGNFPFRVKIKSSIFNPENKPKLANLASYAVFSYDAKFYKFFPQSAKPYDLTQPELEEVNRILGKYFKANTAKLEMALDNYYKQLTAVLTASGEKEVYVVCHCKDEHTNKEFEYYMMRFHDGGSCHLGVKINLSKHSYSEIFVNGEA